MRWLWIVIATGCGFELTPSQAVDGEVIDAPPLTMIDAAFDAPPDAPPDAAIDGAPPTWVAIETLTVSCVAPVATPSVTVLQTGVTYRLRATGECFENTQNGSQTDAEYLGYNVGPSYDYFMGVDNGLAINDALPGATKLPRWGGLTTTHEYEVPWVGAGTVITATFHSENYPNNAGMLSVTIVAFQ